MRRYACTTVGGNDIAKSQISYNVIELQIVHLCHMIIRPDASISRHIIVLLHYIIVLSLCCCVVTKRLSIAGLQFLFFSEFRSNSSYRKFSNRITEVTWIKLLGVI